MNNKGIVLAPRGFPWRAALVAVVGFAACAAVTLTVINLGSTGGDMEVSAIVGIALFAVAV